MNGLSRLLGAAWFVAKHDLRVMLVQRETLLWTFLMPFVFFWFIGTVTSGFSGGGSGKTYLALRVGEDAGFLADELTARLGTEGFFKNLRVTSTDS